MPFSVYIVECADKTLYTGYTKDIARRISEHNHSKYGAKYTRTRRPIKLVYLETFETLSEALHREHQLKKLARLEKITLINKLKYN